VLLASQATIELHHPRAPGPACPGVIEPRKTELVQNELPPELSERVVRTVLVADVVESVRLMQEDESGTIQRWRAFVEHVVHELLRERDGRLVKSLGDGLMLEFMRVNSAVAVAFDMQADIAQFNVALPPERQLRLRIGIHVSPLVADERDVYGHGVNLAARLTTLAGPGEIIVSADVRDQLTPTLDGDIEDLGECYVKHMQQPIRAFRIGAAGTQPVIERGNLADDLRATIAVIPFRPRSLQPGEDVLGQLLADEIISTLSLSPEVNVVSRLSTTAFQGREVRLDQVSNLLRADYVVSGSYHVDGDRLTLKAELAETRSMKAVWSQTFKGSVNGVVAGDDPLANHVVSQACAAMTVHELSRGQGKAPQSLQNHTLLLGSISLMHRISPLAFERSRQMLDVLIERTPRLAAPYAWLAKWHVLRVTQGWSRDVSADGRTALEFTRRALDRDATSSLAMTVEGQVNTYILKRLDVAEQLYAQALQSNPNEALAWLLRGTLHAFRGEGREATRYTRQALRLSPLDPLSFYFLAHAASAALASQQYERCLKLAKESLRLNVTHTSTLRVLVVALWKLDRHEEARGTVATLLKLDPNFTIARYLSTSPSAGFPVGKDVAATLEAAGVPR
jgi:adenylate cyclase